MNRADGEDETRGRLGPQGEPAVPVVFVRGLTKRYGDVAAVDDLTFSLGPGTVTGFLGPNGAGKSTTLRLLLGLAEPTSGEAQIFGHPYERLENAAQKVGAVLESGDFHPARSARSHLRSLALATEIPFTRVEQLLKLVELDEVADRPVRGYSLGMRQRLGLAGALLGDPHLLILDEPANGLDPAGIHWLRGFLREFAAKGRTVLVSSHALAEIEQTVDAVLVLHHGRLIATLALAQLAEQGRSLEDVYLELTQEAP